jgi:hypothetical protein
VNNEWTHTFLEEAEAASYLGVGLRALRRLARKGLLTDYYRQRDGDSFVIAYDLDELRLFKSGDWPLATDSVQ